jgi:hypothetical protein
VVFLFMTKEEVLQALKATREVNTMDNTKNWQEAFALYNVANGARLKAGDRCNKCFTKVLEWLQQ